MPFYFGCFSTKAKGEPSRVSGLVVPLDSSVLGTFQKALLAVLGKPGRGALECQVTLPFLFFLRCWLVTGASEAVENKAIFHIVRKTIVFCLLYGLTSLLIPTLYFAKIINKYLSKDYKFDTFVVDVWLFIQVFILLWPWHAVSGLIWACPGPVSSLKEYLHLVFVVVSFLILPRKHPSRSLVFRCLLFRSAALKEKHDWEPK